MPLGLARRVLHLILALARQGGLLPPTVAPPQPRLVA